MNRHRKTMDTSKLHTLALAATLLIPALMNAQVDRTHAPAPGPAPVVDLGGHASFTLANGMRVIVVENHKIPIVSAQVRFDIPPVMQGDIAGYQDLVGELLTSGTTTHSKAQIDETVDGLGAQLNGTGNGIYASCLTKNFDQLLGLASEVVEHANYPEEEFDKSKTRMLSGIKARGDDPNEIAEVVGHALTFGKDFPYGEVTTTASMEKVTRDQVYAYYRYFFQPKNGYLVLVGDINEKEGKKLAEHYFGSWKGAEVPVTKDAQGHDVVKELGPIIPAGAVPAAAPTTNVAFVDRPGSAQSVIKVVFPVDLKPNDPMAMQAQVMNTIFGGGVFNARLMQNLREDKAYTYGAYSQLDADRWAGSFSAGASVRTAVTDSAAVQIMAELERIRKAPVSADEISLAKSNMAGNFARALEDPKTIARFALNTYLNDLPADYYDTYLQRLDTVNIADVQQAAERFLKPAHATILVVGDKEKVGSTLASLSADGKVVYYDADGDIEKNVVDPVPEGLTAQKVIDDYITAIGGQAAVDKVKDLKREYTTSVQGMSATMTEYNKVPDQYAMQMKMGTMMMQSVVFDGKKGKAGGMQGEKALQGTDLQEIMNSVYAFPELHYRELNKTLELTGVVDVNGKKAYRMKVSGPDGNGFTDYYDVKTGLKLRRTETQGSGGHTMLVTTDYSDYRPEGGVMFPHTVKQNAGMDIVFTASKISVNQGIDASVFKVD
jgi:predicted Zn-dependent peptidase